MYRKILKVGILAAILSLNNLQCFAYVSGYVFNPFGSPVNGITVWDVAGHLGEVTGRFGYGIFKFWPGDGITTVFAPLESYGYLWSPPSYTVVNYYNNVEYGGYNFTRVNRMPASAWTGETGFESNGIDPDLGGSTTTFTFRILYTDADNDAPQGGYPRVVIKKSTTTVLTLPMNYVSGSYVSGAVYSTGTLLAPCSYYTYTFEARDIWNGDAAVVTTSGPAMLADISGMVRDVDGAPMDGVNLSLTGYMAASTQTASDGTYSFTLLPIGETYTVTPSSNAWDRFTPVSRSTTLVNNQAGWDFGKDNTGALLNWTGEDGYTSDAVSPDMGPPENPFEFRIRYSDVDNDAPAAGYPRLIIKKSGSPIAGSPFTMSAADTTMDFVGGKIYRYAKNLTAIGVDYTYYIETKDVRSAVITSSTTELSGPTVTHQPTLAWTGAAGYAADGIDPDTGTIAANYIYRVKYTETDSLPPASGYPRVHIYKNGVDIAGSPFTMSYISGNHNTGSIYSYQATLPIGMDYKYEFEAQNQYLSAAAPRGGYGPQVRTKVSGHMRDAAGNPLGDVTLALSGADSTAYKTTADGYFEFLITTEAFTVTPSSYSWYGFTPGQREYTNCVAALSAEDFIRNTVTPVLSYTGEPGYTSSAVYPQVAQSSNTFVFRVRYQSPGNDAPAIGYPRVMIYKGGSAIRTLPMGYVSGDYRVSGAVYSTGTLIVPCSYYTYAIEALDIFGSAAAPLTASGPDVRAYIGGRVYDADGGPMPGATVSLTGDIFQETQTAPDGSFMLTMLPTGGSYSLTPSSHTYYTFTPAVFSTVLNDNLPVLELHRNNTASALAWSGEAGYDGIRGVLPATGTTSSDLFTFKTVFTDPDDDGYKSLNLYLKKDSVISTIPVSDCYGSFHSGLTCGYSTLINTSGVYSYRFGAVGRWNESIFTPELGLLSMIAPTTPVNDGAVITDNQSVVSAEVTLKWSAADPEGGPLAYDLYVSLTASQVLGAGRIAGHMPAGSAAVLVYSGPGTSYTLHNLTPGRTYYWKVNATNKYGVTTQGTLMNFQTLDLPIDKIFNYPNPFSPARQQTNIVFSVAKAQTVKIRIYSEYGDLVRILETAALAGTNELRFDGRDKSGRMLFNGSYIAVIERAEGPAKCYLLIVK